MHSIALTGPIAGGKSAVLRLFSQHHIPTIDCDAIVGKLYSQKSVQKKLRGEFGTQNRKEIAAIVFSDAGKRKKLEALLHPLVWREVQNSLKKLRKGGKALAVVDVPLLFEARWQNRFNSIAVVSATREQCLQRLQRRGLARKEALLRLKAQIPLRKKIKKARFTIDNTGSLQRAERQVRKLLEELKANRVS